MGTIVINAPNSVLGYPWNAKTLRTGVTDGAAHSVSVTGWIVGYGNGSASTLTLPGIVTSLTTLYRTDWQGTVALSANPRTNNAVNAVWAGGTTPTSWQQWVVGSGAIATATSTLSTSDGAAALTFSIPIANFDRAIVYQRLSLLANTVYMVSVWIEASTSNFRAGDVLTATDPPSGTTVDYPSCPANPSSGLFSIVGVGRLDMLVTVGATAGSALIRAGLGSNLIPLVTGSMRLSRPTFRLNSEPPGAWIPTTTAPVTVTDYSLSGSTVTFAEVPAAKAALSVDAAVSPHPHFYYPFNYR